MKNIIRFNDLSMYECYSFEPTTLGTLDAILVEFRCDVSDLTKTIDMINAVFRNDYVVKKMELVDENENVISAGYIGYGDATLTMNPVSSTEYSVIVQLTKLKMLEEKVTELAKKIDPVVDLSQMTLDELKEYKCKEIQKEISDIIEAGIDVELPSGTEHFSLTILDQINIDKLERRSDKLQVSLPYHSDKFACKFYTPKELALISIVADSYITQFTTLINSYNVWIRRSETADEVMAITSNSSLPADLQEHMTSILAQLNATIEGYMTQMTEPVNSEVEIIPPSEVEVVNNENGTSV